LNDYKIFDIFLIQIIKVNHHVPDASTELDHTSYETPRIESLFDPNTLEINISSILKDNIGSIK